MSRPLFHVIWTTYETSLPSSSSAKNGELEEIYSDLAEKSIPFYMPVSIGSGTDRKQAEKRLTLDGSQLNELQSILEDLTESDRIAGENKILASILKPSEIELLIECQPERLQQVTGRLKSRSASILMRSKQQRTLWSKGFWYAQNLSSTRQHGDYITFCGHWTYTRHCPVG